MTSFVKMPNHNYKLGVVKLNLPWKINEWDIPRGTAQVRVRKPSDSQVTGMVQSIHRSILLNTHLQEGMIISHIHGVIRVRVSI